MIFMEKNKMHNKWFDRSNEKNLLKVVEWAHRNSIPIEKLTEQDIITAVTTYLRDSLHS